MNIKKKENLFRHRVLLEGNLLRFVPQVVQTLFVIYIRDSIALRFEPFKRTYENGSKIAQYCKLNIERFSNHLHTFS